MSNAASILFVSEFKRKLYLASSASDYFWLATVGKNAVDEGFVSWLELGIDLQTLQELQMAAHRNVLRTELTATLAKDLTTEDIPVLHRLVGEIKYGNINEAQLGFKAKSLLDIVHCLARGDYPCNDLLVPA